MRGFQLTEHSFLCERQDKSHWLNDICDLNPERFLFYLNGQFALITYNKCLEFGNHLNYKQDLIDKIITQNKIYDIWDVERVNIEMALQNYRRTNHLKKYISQVNYIYSNNAGKEYCITTRVKFVDALINNDALIKNYKAGIISLEEKKLDYLLPQLEKLYKANIFYCDSEIEICKTIDHLVTQINKLTK